MSDKAHFHMSGYVNKQNCRYWAPNKPHELNQRPLHSAKVTVVNNFFPHGITGLPCFENMERCPATVKAEWYKATLGTFL
jgi:hypothetical protein